MKPYYTDEWLTLYGGDCLDVLREMPADSVDCVVTSPPYWGLRDYGSEGQLGLERTPEEYVANMVAVFREVRRVLKPSGTCWLNLGDSYTSIGRTGRKESPGVGATQGMERVERDVKWQAGGGHNFSWSLPGGQKPKDLVGIPWMVAFALRADGWYLRSDIIWSKPNPMPESVTDRPTKSHEYLFLLTKSPRYYFDADAVREQSVRPEDARLANNGIGLHGGKAWKGSTRVYGEDVTRRNIRSVWNIATRPYPGAHFAVFPPELPERCIKAGSSERGVCPECGAPWVRVVEREPGFESRRQDEGGLRGRRTGGSTNGYRGVGITRQETTGWLPTCQCTWYTADGKGPEWMASSPAVILDPFGGSGTVGMVANRLSRRAILIDLNPEYLKQQMKRNAQTPLGLDAA